MTRIGIVDYGMGNLLSVFHAVEMIGGEPRICRHAEQILDVDRILLPGVGSFGRCMANLDEGGFRDALEEAVIQRGKPFFGICLGMQVLASRGFEGGEQDGLGWIEGEATLMEPSDRSLRVPQIGWNDVQYRKDSPLFQRLPAAPDFYFVHSYCLHCREEECIDATCDYGGEVTAALRRDNIFATQFHPEKSQDLGLTVLENFLRWKP